MNTSAPSILAVGGAGMAPPADKASVSAWYALVVLIGVTLFAFVDRQIINLVAPSLQKMLRLSDLQLGALQGLGLALFASAASYPIGWLADRFGRRRVLACCVLLWSFSTAACALQTTFAGLFAATAGIAIGEAALSPIIFSMLPDLFPEKSRNTANFVFFGAVLLGAAVGFGLGGVTLGLLAKHQHGLPGVLATMDSWRVALIIVAAPAPLFVLLLGTLRMRESVAAVTQIDKAAHSAELHQVLPYIRTHWRTLVCIYGAITAYGFPLNSSFTWLPVLLPRVFGTASADVGVQLGVTIAIGTLAGLALPPVGTWILRRDTALGPLRLARFFTAAAILPTFLQLFVTAPWQIYALVGVQFVFVLAIGALMPGLLQQIAPSALRSRVIAILGVVQSVSTGAAPVLVGAVSSLLHWPRGLLLAIVVVSVPSWLIATILLTLARRPFLATTAALREVT